MLEFPGNIRFDAAVVPGVLRVSYVEPPATPKHEAAVLREPLDLWAIAWALNTPDAPRVVDVRPPRGLSRARWRTLVLRLEVLSDLVEGFEFRLDGTKTYLKDAAEIRDDMRRGLLFTYDRGNLSRGAPGTKPTPESVAEAWIADHGKKFLGGAFPHGLRRQFPAHSFKTSMDEKNRATAKLWIDLLGVDLEGRLSAAELKIGDNLPLGLLAQGLDCVAFCRAYLPHLRRNWFPQAAEDRLALYLVADRFHPAVLRQEGDTWRSVSEVLRFTPWLDVVFVQIDSTGLPQALSERLAWRLPEAAPVPGTVVEAAADAVAEPVAEPVAQPEAEPVAEPVEAPESAPAPAPAPAAADEPPDETPVMAPAAEPIADPVA